MTVLPLMSLEDAEAEFNAAVEHADACQDRHDRARGPVEYRRTLEELQAAFDALTVASERWAAVRSQQPERHMGAWGL